MPGTKRKSDGTTKVEHEHWLMKSEPESRFENGIDMKFGIEDLKVEPDQEWFTDNVQAKTSLSCSAVSLIYQ